MRLSKWWVLILAGFLFFAAPAWTAVPTDGLVAEFLFNEDAYVSGITWDTSGYLNDGNVYGAVLTTGRDGTAESAYAFNGVDSYIEIFPASQLEFGTGPFSISVWLKYPSQKGGTLDYAMIIVKASTEAPYEGLTAFADWPADGAVCFRTTSDPYLSTSNVTLNDNAWHHFVFIRNGTTLSVYIDGVLNATTTTAEVTDCTNDEFMYLGVNQDNKYTQNFEGVMDDLRIYNRALSVAEVQSLYTETSDDSDDDSDSDSDDDSDDDDGDDVDDSGTPDTAAAEVNLTRIESGVSGTIAVGDAVTYRASATSVTGQDIYYRFGYVPGYDTDAYATAKWVKVQDWSTEDTCEFTFPSAGSYIITVDAANSASPAGYVSLMGGSITVGSAPDIVFTDLQFEMIHSPSVDNSVTVKGSASSDTVSEIYYRFGFRPDYGTDDYATSKWVKVQDWSTTDTCTFTFDEPGGYVLTMDASETAGTPAHSHLMGGTVQIVANDLGDGTLLTSATIDAQGGTLASGDFSLSVPSGAFASAATLSLYQYPNATVMSGCRDGAVYGINGLPDTFSQPLTITVSNVTAQTPVAFLRDEDGYTPSFGNGSQVFGTVLEPVVSGTTATVIIPATGETSSGPVSSYGVPKAADESSASSSRLAFWLSSDTATVVSVSGNFKVVYPNTITGQTLATEIATALESAYNNIESLDLSWTGRTRWPVTVNLFSFPDDAKDRYGQEEPSKLGVNYHTVSINYDKFKNAADYSTLRTTIGHELFHLNQFLYDPRNRYSQAVLSGPWMWMDEAMSTWFEHKMNVDPTFIPSTVSGDNFSFVQQGLEVNSKTHGYGASMFLKYLTDTAGLGDKKIGDLLKLKPTTDPPTAALASVISGLDTYWPTFIDKYLEPSLYSVKFPTADQISGLCAGRTYFFSSESDTGTTFSWWGRDLSAQVFKVVPKYQFSDDTNIVLSLQDATGKAQAIVYRYRKEPAVWERLGTLTTTSSLTADGNSLANNGEYLIITLINPSLASPYTVYKNINLVVKKETVQTPVNTCSRHTEFSKNLTNEDLITYVWITGADGDLTESSSSGVNTYTIAQGFLCPDYSVRVRIGAKTIQTVRSLAISVNGTVRASLEDEWMSRNTYQDFDVTVQSGDTMTVTFESGDGEFTNIFNGTFRSQ